ncbi:MAG TPA: kelch repeat-containing protein [Planctomycetota bacterium]|nr:kelch repeat-containing protein [Planctomycetota bacterium]
MDTPRRALLVLPFLSPLLAQTNWTLLTPATSPPAFTAHAMAHHLPTDRTVLFGGVFAGVRYNETWLFDTVNWVLASPTNVPPARVAHSMAYDLARGRIVMFGGIPVGGGYLGDTWEWDGVDWQQMTPAVSPSARWSFSMAYHLGRQTVVLWGGYHGGDLNDMWEWDGTNWAPIVTTNSPSPRRASDMAYDPVTNGIVLFSGYLQPSDTWLFDGVNWVQQFPATSPSPRYDHSMVTDFARGRIVLFGNVGPADTWEWDGALGNWLYRATPTLPAPRNDTYLSYDLIREQVMMFGSVAVPETWLYAPTNPASFFTSGTSCAGTLSVAPTVTSTERPWLGQTFHVAIHPVPNNTVAIMIVGLSDTMSGSTPLPIPLALIGMPGCTLQVDPVVIDAFFAIGDTATWAFPVPAATSLLGVQVFAQGGAIDIGANPANLILANHGTATLGGK